MEKMFLENNNVIFFNSYYIFLGLDHFWMLERKQFQWSMVLILGSCKKKYKICMQITSMFIYEEYLYDSILRFFLLPPLSAMFGVSDPVRHWPDLDPTSQDKPDPDPDPSLIKIVQLCYNVFD